MDRWNKGGGWMEGFIHSFISDIYIIIIIHGLLKIKTSSRWLNCSRFYNMMHTCKYKIQIHKQII